MPLSETEEFQVLLAVYTQVNERARHYHQRMWETGRDFFWGYTLPMSAAAFLYSHTESAVFQFASIPLALLAMGIAIYGKRLLGQERLLFAYELRVRLRLERTLGWRLQYPQITELTGFKATAYTDPPPDLRFDPQAVTWDPKKYNAIEFDVADRRAALAAAQERRGGYGILQRLLSFAWLFALGAAAYFSAQVFLPRSAKAWIVRHVGLEAPLIANSATTTTVGAPTTYPTTTTCTSSTVTTTTHAPTTARPGRPGAKPRSASLPGGEAGRPRTR